MNEQVVESLMAGLFNHVIGPHVDAEELLEALEVPGAVPATGASLFSEVGLVSENRGVVVEFEDGSEFQITVVQSRRPDRE